MQNEIKKIKSIKRRNFFSTIGKSILGLMFINSLPIKLFAKNNRKKINSVKVNIHPLAVKRNKRG